MIRVCIRIFARPFPHCSTFQLESTPVNSVSITPTVSVSIAIAKTVQFSAQAKDVLGNVVTGRTTTWTSASPAIATVNSAGLVTGAQVGTTHAFIDGYSSATSIAVTAVVLLPLKVVIGGADECRQRHLANMDLHRYQLNCTLHLSMEAKRHSGIDDSASFTGTTSVADRSPLLYCYRRASQHCPHRLV